MNLAECKAIVKEALPYLRAEYEDNLDSWEINISYGTESKCDVEGRTMAIVIDPMAHGSRNQLVATLRNVLRIGTGGIDALTRLQDVGEPE